ncbi:MAG: hypothetical protein KJ062_19115, partial [Thermoanaerobaculia bacterium]|nr:hypothetical protein [Thermoanaerobaculia bacterium]
RLARAADIAVNLRFPTVGETSGAVCRLAGSGLPVVVSDVGWFRELPESFASRIPVGEGEAKAVAEALGGLAADGAVRAARAAAARAWGEARSPERIAAAYARVVREVMAGGAPALGLAGRLSRELESLGVGREETFGTRERGPDGRLLVEIGLRAAGVLPAPLTPFVEVPEG